MSNKDKFECDTCGCFFMTDDRDTFVCPNCERDEIDPETEYFNNIATYNERYAPSNDPDFMMKITKI